MTLKHHSIFWALIILVNSASIKEDLIEISDFHTSDNRDNKYRVNSNNSIEEEKVFNGNVAQPHYFPFIVELTYPDYSHTCGGSLLTSKHIITAAHCVVDLNPSQPLLAIVGHQYTIPPSGESESGRQEIQFTKSNVKIHPRYDPNGWHNDVAIITLDQEFKLIKTVQTICIAAAQKRATVAGWGYPDCSTTTSNVLRQAAGSVISNGECKKDYDSIGPAKLCILFNDQSSHTGDSGGPLVHRVNGKFQLVGIVSYSVKRDGCPVTTVPAVFARANQFHIFIKDAVGKTCFC